MNKGTAVVIAVVLGSMVLGVGVVEYFGRRKTGTSPLAEAVKSVVTTLATPAPRIVEKKDDGKADAKANAAAAKPAARPRATAKPTAPDLPADARTIVPTPEPVIEVPPAAVPAPEPPRSIFRAPESRRSDPFVAGNRQAWESYQITLDRPMLVRAGGVVRAGDVVSGPGGLADRAATAEKVLPGAPYLGLIGRVCSTERCSSPFFIGAQTVICPSALGVSGDLQLWTNNYVQVDGYQTLNSYTRAAGGYRFQAEPASAVACDDPSPVRETETSAENPAAPLGEGQVLTNTQYAVSSRQNAWKPFFLPLKGPLVIRASGEMQPHERTRPTGPNGIAVPAAATSWTYPGSRTIVVDSTRVLMDRRLPYQSLIGRLCSASTCGEPFLVGAERTVCPHPTLNERLELWINHIVPREETLTVPFANLEFQGRRGEYRFSVAGAAAGACAK